MTRRQLLHDIRGRMNGLQLCVAALETSPTPAESIEFLDDIITVSEKLDRLMVKLEELLEEEPESADAEEVHVAARR